MTSSRKESVEFLSQQPLEYSSSDEETPALSHLKENCSNLPEPQVEQNSPQKSSSWMVFNAKVPSLPNILNKELKFKNVKLQQLNRLKDEFLASISHELKSPITAIMGLASLLKENKLGELNRRQARYVELIYSSTRQLMSLVNNIVDFTNLETGQLKLTPEKIEIKALCQRAWESIEEQRKDEISSEIKFHLKIEPELKTIVADQLRLHQILVYLLDNSLSFTQAKGEIGIKVNRWKNWIAFTIWDTGTERIEISELEESIGLRLILTQRLARAHGGDVSFISKLGQGSEFTLLLPLSPTQIEMNGEKIELEINSQQGENLILIIEATPEYIENLTDKLLMCGCRAVIARSGTEALEKARQLQPDLIFLNPILPLLSGWDVLTLLKSDVRTQNIPTIITATRADKQQSEKSEANGFLSLPIEKEDLQKIFIDSNKKSSVQNNTLKILHIHRDPGKISWESWELNHRILEADSLEQAEMLAKIWKIDAIVLDNSTVGEEPLTYMQAFKECEFLACLPLITLDAKTTEAANQVKGLSVFPCLFPVSEQTFGKLLEVIQIAAKIDQKIVNPGACCQKVSFL